MAILKKLPKINKEPFERLYFEDEEAWLNGRKNGIGGSDAGVILGVNKWKSRTELFAEKTGRAEAEDISDKEAVKFGKEAEKPIRQLVALDFPEWDIYENSFMILQSKEHPRLQYSPDGEIFTLEESGKGLLEIKTTTVRSNAMLADWNDKVPESYYAQLLHGLLVTDYDFAVLRVLIRFAWDSKRQELRDYFFTKKQMQSDMELLLEKELEFVSDLENDKIPSLILPDIRKY